MGNQDLPDIYAHALGPAALELGHIYQANPSCPCYNLYLYHGAWADQRVLPWYNYNTPQWLVVIPGLVVISWC